MSLLRGARARHSDPQFRLLQALVEYQLGGPTIAKVYAELAWEDERLTLHDPRYALALALEESRKEGAP